MKITLGIDPGIAAGGIVALADDLTIIGKDVMPTFLIELDSKKKDGSNKTEKQIDFKELFNIVQRYHNEYEVDTYVERITHLFGLPGSSNFRLGYACGVIHACLQTFGDFHMVKPRIWQNKIWIENDIVKKPGTNKKDTKLTTLNAASRIFPDECFTATERAKKPHDGIVDAALIAFYGRNL